MIYYDHKIKGTMLPTFQAKNRLLTLRIYCPKKLKRGDIIVFYSNEKKMLIIKRLIGLPGDYVQISKVGSLLINGNKEEEKFCTIKSSFALSSFSMVRLNTKEFS
ncbi:MAG: signal peptidase I [Clostridiaceae bacterium]|mgnify:CR=1 FL=1|nr:signal peptidase I [Clostridiaceae bacterium]